MAIYVSKNGSTFTHLLLAIHACVHLNDVRMTNRATNCAAEMVMGILKQAVEQEFLAQLNSVYSDSSSPEYKKHLKNIPVVAEHYVQARKLSVLYRAQQEGHIKIVFSKPADELFDQLGQAWLSVDQFDDALAAFKTCVEISRPREGPWWAQRHCARYNHLGYAHMILGNKQEQLRASLKSASYAVAILNSAVDSVTFSDIFQLSFCNVAIQISDCNPVIDTVMQFRKDTLQVPLPVKILVYGLSVE